MRKINVFFFVFMLLLCLTGCDEANTQNDNTQNEPTEASVQSITLSKSEINMVVGDEVSISASISPSNATDKNLTWSSTNTTVADYINGKIVALGEGTCIIKAKSKSIEASCVVNVERKKVYIDEISFSEEKYTFTQGTENELVLCFSPNIVDDLTGTVIANDTHIATVTYDAGYNVEIGNYIRVLVQAENPGITSILLTLSNGISCSTEITVVEPVTNFDLIIDTIGTEKLKLGSLWGTPYELSGSESGTSLTAYCSSTQETSTGGYNSYTKSCTYSVHVGEDGEGTGWCSYTYYSIQASGYGTNINFTTTSYTARVHFKIKILNLGESTDYILEITDTSCSTNRTPVISNSSLSVCKDYTNDFTDTLVESLVIIVDEITK